MKFSTILRSAFFALFIFTATATFATTDTTKGQENVQMDKEDVGHITTISGRMAEVVDDEDDTSRSDAPYTMRVRVMKAGTVFAEASANVGTLTIDLEDLEAGMYLFVIDTPDGTSREFVRLD